MGADASRGGRSKSRIRSEIRRGLLRPPKLRGTGRSAQPAVASGRTRMLQPGQSGILQAMP
jgi:hypothetical protein